ncbi:hypothetical protein LTR50_000557 [Elasticomyces elasticus]|nr:hypothetical protein LTR50_000483 [Elasticomyces elasticus]KAK4993333.1 hypothetical protein LTR50_000557 [Elasticomyces elasticus]
MRTKRTTGPDTPATSTPPAKRRRTSANPHTSSSATRSVKEEALAPPTTQEAQAPPQRQPKSESRDLHSEDITPSTAEIARLLDGTENPFTVKSQSLNKKKRRRSSTSAAEWHEERNIFGEKSLDLQYKIVSHTRVPWGRLKKYKRFTLGEGETIQIGDCILVANADSQTLDDGEIDVFSQWKAQALEIRAADPAHVYVRIVYLNRPEDLPGGRKDYHGRYELVVTNYMTIIDATTVNGKLEVKRWPEDPSETGDASLLEDDYFWRQTLNVETNTLSELTKHCIDNAPHNPDELLLQCSDTVNCRKWLHMRCIVENAAERAYKKYVRDEPTAVAEEEEEEGGGGVDGKKKGPRNSNGVPRLKASEAFDVNVQVPSREGEGRSTITISDRRPGRKGRKWVEDVKCLFCGIPID